MDVREYFTTKSFLTAVVIVLLIALLKRYYSVIYANFINWKSASMQKGKHAAEITSIKAKLFEVLTPGSRIVEIGAGAGANFESYPKGCQVVCVEPNAEFHKFIDRTTEKRGSHLHSVDVKQEFGENLSRAIEPNSADFVVATMVLCAVKDGNKTMQEVKKILKPGGSFLFMEHVRADNKHRIQQIFQDVLSILTMLVLGAVINAEPWRHNYREGRLF